MVEIDGSQGEGGGQILRSALALSLITGKALRIERIRAGRSKPGLRAQHLQAVQAAAAVGQAEVEGAALGADSLVFRPRGAVAGRFHFDIGTAGSTILVLQTVFVPLSMAGSTSEITITGGTHVRWSPCYHYLDWHWRRFMARIGYEADTQLERAGYYPQGGGRLRARIHSGGELSPLRLVRRGALVRIRGLSAVSNLPNSIAERQRSKAVRGLRDMDCPLEIEVRRLPAQGKGTVLVLLAEFEETQVCTFGLGERGKPAERVADEAVEALQDFLTSGATVDKYLADQLLLPLTLVPEESTFKTSKVTQHLLTNAQVMRAFNAVCIDIEGALGQAGTVRVRPSG